jgi:hypothetical protein
MTTALRSRRFRLVSGLFALLVLMMLTLESGLASAGSSASQAMHSVVSAKLSRVPKGLTHASGSAVIRLNTKTRKACWTISVSGIDKPLSAHVRKAPPGKIGPVIIPLGAYFAKSGCVILPLKSVKAVGTNPSA